MEAFHYPNTRHRRRHGPEGYEDLESFRPWLRDEFLFRCVYCLEREQWSNIIAAFHIDHFQPIASRPGDKLEYDNLLYVCRACNLVKGDQAILDPLRVLLSDAVIVHSDGRIEGMTASARRLIEQMALNRGAYRQRRQLIGQIVALARRHDRMLYRALLGFPEQLPDLSRLRPPGNKRPSGIGKSCFARAAAGSLPEIY